MIFSCDQICWCSPFGKRSIELLEHNESNIERFRSDWKTVPGIKPGAVDNFIDIFDKFRSNSTDEEIIEGTVSSYGFSYKTNWSWKCLVFLHLLWHFVFQVQLVSLAIEVDASKINKTILEQFSHKNSTEKESSSEEHESTSPKGITENDLKELEKLLSKELTPAQTKLAMDIFHGFREGATAKEKEAALVSFQ